MKLYDHSRVQRIKDSVLRRLDFSLTTRSALGISLGLHIFLGLTLAALWAGNAVLEHKTAGDKIVFDLQPIKEAPKLNGVQGEAAQEYGVSNPDALKESGKASTPVRGNMNRDAVAMATLAALSDLRDSFSFITHTVAADSLGGLSPLEGNVPGSEYDSFGRKKGQGLGFGGIQVSVSGGGFCPAPGR